MHNPSIDVVDHAVVVVQAALYAAQGDGFTHEEAHLASDTYAGLIDQLNEYYDNSVFKTRDYVNEFERELNRLVRTGQIDRIQLSRVRDCLEGYCD